MPLSRKYSPIAHPEYGAKYCSGAASEAVAETTILSKDLFKVYCLILSLKKREASHRTSISWRLHQLASSRFGQQLISFDQLQRICSTIFSCLRLSNASTKLIKFQKSAMRLKII